MDHKQGNNEHILAVLRFLTGHANALKPIIIVRLTCRYHESPDLDRQCCQWQLRLAVMKTFEKEKERVATKWEQIPNTIYTGSRIEKEWDSKNGMKERNQGKVIKGKDIWKVYQSCPNTVKFWQPFEKWVFYFSLKMKRPFLFKTWSHVIIINFKDTQNYFGTQNWFRTRFP